jgi:hypothetical protein
MRAGIASLSGFTKRTRGGYNEIDWSVGLQNEPACGQALRPSAVYKTNPPVANKHPMGGRIGS